MIRIKGKFKGNVIICGHRDAYMRIPICVLQKLIIN